MLFLVFPLFPRSDEPRAWNLYESSLRPRCTGPLIIIPTAFNWRVAEFSTELVTLPPFLSVTFGSPRSPLVHMQLQRTDFSLLGALLSSFSTVLPILGKSCQ
jgi:hypothetical protein